MIPARPTRYQYRVDKDDTIVWVNAAWLAFARENNAAELTDSSVVGRCLWTYIGDQQTCDTYQRLYSQVRDRQQTAVIPFRCDSPHMRREMRLTISQDAKDETLLCESVIVQVAPHRYLSVLDPARSRTAETLTMCSCCKRVLIEPEGWVDIETFCERLCEQGKIIRPTTRQSLCLRCSKLLRTCPN